MGLTNEAFWNLTLRQFLMLADRHKERQARADRRAGEIVAMIYNVHRDIKKDPRGRTWLDFFSEHNPPRVARTEEDMMAALDLWSMTTQSIPES